MMFWVSVRHYKNWLGPQIDRFLITLYTKKYIFRRRIEMYKGFESKGHMGREESTWNGEIF